MANNVEIFQHPQDYDLNETDGCPMGHSDSECPSDIENDEPWDDDCLYSPGIYYWYCFPGCLPDSNPFGPFQTVEEAKADYGDDDVWNEEDKEYHQS